MERFYKKAAGPVLNGSQAELTQHGCDLYNGKHPGHKGFFVCPFLQK
jgi:hypothetical protein